MLYAVFMRFIIAICSFHEIYNRCFMAEDPKEEFRKYVEEQFREQILGGREND